jgi:4'-phosphopantetheinyl transferase
MIVNHRSLSFPLTVGPIAQGAIDLWTASLSALHGRYEQLSAVLSPQELLKAQAYKLEQHRRRYRMTRGLLRLLLGAYLGRDPAELPIAHGEAGKPALHAGLFPHIAFNLSHSRDAVALAFCLHADIGVDVEYLDDELDRESIVTGVFSQAEIASYRTATPQERLRRFFCIWTRKEARLKARGLDMAHLRDEAAERLPVRDFEFGDCYVGALALAARISTSAPPRSYTP